MTKDERCIRSVATVGSVKPNGEMSKCGSACQAWNRKDHIRRQEER